MIWPSTVKGDTTVLQTECFSCRRKHSLAVKTEHLQRWQRGEMIQDCTPDLDDNDRERLISGTCPECWDKMWPEDAE